MLGRPLTPLSVAGARRRGRRRGLVVGAAVGAGMANARRQRDEEAYDDQYAEPAANEDAITQLERLAELKDKGILSEAEFAEQKAKLLG